MKYQGCVGGADASLSIEREGLRLGSMLDRRAAERALAAGDAEALRRMLGELLATEEGRRFAEKLGRLR